MPFPGGGTLPRDGELLGDALVLLPLDDPLKTLPLKLVCGTPPTVKTPPIGALVGIVLPEALAARAVKASRVLPVVGALK